MEWKPIETAPEDGSFFIAARLPLGEYPLVELGRYSPLMSKTYEPAQGGLFREVKNQIYDWDGFNNMHKMTHWAEVEFPPTNEGG